MMINDNTVSRLAEKPLEFIERELWVRFNIKQIKDFLLKNDNADFREVAEYIGRKGVSVIPYSFRDKYSLKDIIIRKHENGLLYTLYEGRTLFLKRKYMSILGAGRYLNNLFIEQDPESPHRYLTDDFYPVENDVVLDIGGAEGIFALSYIDHIKKLYIFECDPEWVEALKYTYKDHSEKVVIVEKFVSDIDDDKHISLDTFAGENGLFNEDLFIKIDAEGSEPLIINGAEKLLKNTPEIRMALCIYHAADHERLFREKFSEWKIEASEGYMFYYYDYNIKEPYLRKGLLRLTKENCE